MTSVFQKVSSDSPKSHNYRNKQTNPGSGRPATTVFCELKMRFHQWSLVLLERVIFSICKGYFPLEKTAKRHGKVVKIF